MIRLQKVLADRGVASRRRAEELIAGGHVRVDGEVVTTLGTRVAEDARIEVDGVATHRPIARHIALHKPKGIVSTSRDERGRRTVVDIVGLEERLYPVGRLDADSEGLLFLTNDGGWAEHVLHPRYGHEREYDVSVTGELTPAALAQLRRGIRLEEGLARAERVEVSLRSRGTSRLRFVLRTGWKRQIRRMCAAVGLHVERLVRIRIGPVSLGRLRSGEWRPLTAKEITDLAKVIPTQPARPGRRAAARAAREMQAKRSTAAPAPARPAAQASRGPRPASTGRVTAAPTTRSDNDVRRSRGTEGPRAPRVPVAFERRDTARTTSGSEAASLPRSREGFGAAAGQRRPGSTSAAAGRRMPASTGTAAGRRMPAPTRAVAGQHRRPAASRGEPQRAPVRGR